jgi:2-C-methyl-D-erythritol 2,4-cyclodiphosphate synthase
LLSAVGLKDIGHYFPDTDEKWRGANSMQMLEQVLTLIKAQGFAPKNVSIAIQAEKPRLAKYIGAMKENICKALELDQSSVGITAGTNEKLGYVGEGKGITTYASVLLRAL